MSFDNEIRLINVAWKGDGSAWKELVSAKLTPEMFFDQDAALVYKFALDQQQKHGKFPSETFVKQSFPVFPRIKVTDPISLLIDAFKEWRRSQIVKVAIQESAEEYAKDGADKALARMESAIAQVAAESVSADGDIDLTENTRERYDAYLAFAQRPPGLLGYPTGFATLDDILSGMQPKQLITVVALPKVGKSTLAMQMAISAHYAGARVMFQTIEMSSTEMSGRYECQRAGISYTRFRTGTLKKSEERRYEKMLTETDKMPNPFVVTESVINLAQISAKIEEYEPNIVVVDGVYLLQSHPDFAPGSAQALTHLSRSFKKLCQSTNTTIILTTQALQAKLQGGKLSPHSIGYSSSFLQDSDLVIGLEMNDADDHDARELSILASRHSGTAKVTLDWDWENALFAESGTW